LLEEVVFAEPFTTNGRHGDTTIKLFPVRYDRNLHVRADGVKIKEVMQELIYNGWKAAGRNLKGDRWVWIELKPGDGHAILEVKNKFPKGCLDEEMLEKLNDVEGKTVESRLGGTGFGHLWCQRIVSLHDGSLTYRFEHYGEILVCAMKLPLWVQSMHGKGELHE